jgi:hypothetical protein
MQRRSPAAMLDQLRQQECFQTLSDAELGHPWGAIGGSLEGDHEVTP